MKGLAKFVLARLAEDEARARCALSDRRHRWSEVDFLSEHLAEFGRRYDPARVLADCQAKRRIVEDFAEWQRDNRRSLKDFDRWLAGRPLLGRPDRSTPEQWGGLGHAVKVLASVYSDHPDYDPGWKI